jgi:hypothetical protein
MIGEDEVKAGQDDGLQVNVVLLRRLSHLQASSTANSFAHCSN